MITMKTENTHAADITRHSIVVTRTYDAPRERVYSVRADPRHIGSTRQA